MALGDFPAALAGNRSGLKVRVAGKPMKAAFEGAISVKPTLKIEGTLAADAASLRDALVWAGQKPLPGGGFGHFAIKAQTDVIGGTIGLNNVNIELDGNTAEGVLTFATDGRKTLQGTLAADYARSVALCLHRAPAHRQPARLEQRLASRSTACPAWTSTCACRRRTWRCPTPRSAAPRSPPICAAVNLIVTVGEAQAYGGVIKGSLDAGQFRRRRGREIATAIQRRRPGKLPRPVVRAAPARRQGQHRPLPSKAAATACSASPARSTAPPT